MFKILLIACILYVANCEEVTLENCKCGEGYAAKADASGKIQCEGILLENLRACNVPESPRCVCTKDKVSAILSDDKGTWCIFSEGDNKKKWECENTEEWAQYKVDLEEYQKAHH